MPNNYMEKLYLQYANATGLKSLTNNYSDPSFVKWLNTRSVQLQEYLKFIESLGVKLENSDMENLFRVEPKGVSVVELDKGAHDSLHSNGAVVSSEFAPTLSLPATYIKVVSGRAAVITPTEARKIITLPRFISHNAYDKETLERLASVYKSGYSVLYGVFGSKNDRDMNQKIGEILELQEILLDDGEAEYKETPDSYYYVIRTEGSKREDVTARYR